MTIANLPYILRASLRPTIVVTFDDGDRYPMSTLDLWGENDDGEFEIYAKFTDCLDGSNSHRRALAEQIQNCFYRSDSRDPVAMLYTLDRIASVYDEDDNYFLYERDSSS